MDDKPNPQAHDDAIEDLDVDPAETEEVVGGKASSILFQSCATGTHIKEATITH